MKGLSLSYNRDLQEDKEGLFDTVDTLLATLDVFVHMVSSLHVKGERMHSAAAENHSLATDIADYLVKKGVPFRQAHAIVSKLVRYAMENKKTLSELDITEYKNDSINARKKYQLIPGKPYYYTAQNMDVFINGLHPDTHMKF
jgi:argininosuccinate lyase